MPRTDLNDLLAFRAVAQERSFTRAASQLGISQSALSQTVRGLEARLGLRLLTPHDSQRGDHRSRRASAAHRGPGV